ncbi:MAG: rRNA maturation RNase YbeY [Hyphomicrobiaceae bacterium]|nr:rRNA maturation RNase YbeY [Hyphomicrobiaceae bacterium]
MPSGPVVDILEDDGDWSFVPDVSVLVQRAAEAAGSDERSRLGGTAASIVLSSDAEVRILNATWRSMDKPTNVLSFPAAPAPHLKGHGRTGEPSFIGDVVLAAETIAREATILGVPAAHHVQHLVVHGLLHLAGFDHEDDAEATVMESLETCILSRLGIPDPYADDAAGERADAERQPSRERTSS